MSLFDFMRRGWPSGWSQPAPLYNKYTGQYEKMPITWVKGRPARPKDIAALREYYNGRDVIYDTLSIVGKRDRRYTTERRQREKELRYNFFDRWRF